MKFPVAPAYYAVGNETGRREQDVDWFDSTQATGQNKERSSRQGQARQETGAPVYLSSP